MNRIRKREEKWRKEGKKMRCMIEILERKIGKLEEEMEGKEKEQGSLPGEERVKGNKEGRKGRGIKERVKRIEKIMEREKREEEKEKRRT